MLILEIPGEEFYDEEADRFITGASQTLRLEHSLVSISKWEGKWHKSFLSTADKTDEEMIDYIRCMTITQHVPDEFYYTLPPEAFEKILEYIQDPMTATTFSENAGRPSREIITAEVIYYWMIAHTIPFECQKWHINRLLTLIRVCNAKTQKPKKMNKQEALRRQRELNAERRAKLGTSG